MLASARHKEIGALIGAVIRGRPAAVEIAHDFGIAFERDQIFSISFANQRQREARGLERRRHSELEKSAVPGRMAL